jgi:hypothetical protein
MQLTIFLPITLLLASFLVGLDARCQINIFEQERWKEEVLSEEECSEMIHRGTYLHQSATVAGILEIPLSSSGTETRWKGGVYGRREKSVYLEVIIRVI